MGLVLKGEYLGQKDHGSSCSFQSCYPIRLYEIFLYSRVLSVCLKETQITVRAKPSLVNVLVMGRSELYLIARAKLPTFYL